jgi:hypothetical protein
MAQLRLARLIRPLAGPSLKNGFQGLPGCHTGADVVGWKACPVANRGRRSMV